MRRRIFAAMALSFLLMGGATPGIGWASPEKVKVLPNPFKRLEAFMTPETLQQFKTLYQQAMNDVDARRLRDMHRWLTEEPHVAGTARSEDVARFLFEQFRSAGLRATLDGYQVLLSYPKHVALTLVEPIQYDFDLRERGLALDKDAYDRKVWLPFNGYAASGDITAQIIYVNYGREEDYAELKKMGVDVRGRIVLARYGAIFRGVKAMLAEKNGAIGMILYSDPRDDGYHRGDVYPFGPWRPDWAVQRGSVMWMTRYPGDPLSPGFASPSAGQPEGVKGDSVPLRERSARKKPLSPKQAENLPHIPVLPVSYGNARRIFEQLGGPVAPYAWQGGLPLTYHLGPGPAKVHMVVEMEQPIRPIYNVIGWIPGTTGEVVLIGNHHDAWTYGAVDPSSGTTVLVEVARVLGQRVKKGYRPRRTIMFAEWDGEEYGLLGSTEFVERYLPDLQKKLVAYINCDSAVSGKRPGASAVPQLRRWIEIAADLVPHPVQPGSLLTAWLARVKNSGAARPPVGFLGSGSDYTAFLDHAGLPSLSVGLSGAYGVYHANIDDFFWMNAFTDPDYTWHRTIARWLVNILLIGVESERYPFDFRDYGSALLNSFRKIEPDIKALEDHEIMALYQTVLGRIEKWNKQLQDFQEEGKRRLQQHQLKKLQAWNSVARRIDQLFIDEQGLPGRPWFRHLIFAPGLDLGYGARVFPGVRESLKTGDLSGLKQQLRALKEAFDRQIALLESL